MRVSDTTLRRHCDAFPVTPTEEDLLEVALDLDDLRREARRVLKTHELVIDADPDEHGHYYAGFVDALVALETLVATPGESAAKGDR